MSRIRSTITRTAVVAAIAAGATALGAAPAQATTGSWAAIAFSVRTGAIAYAVDRPSATAASDAAEHRCGAADCRAVVHVTNGCAAVAQAPNRAWGWAYGGSLRDAERAAVRATPGRGARVLAYACSGYHR
jgi:hypothetical protein